MPTLTIDIKNCYGIKELKYDFYFDIDKNISDKVKTYSIYAPNGSMKSSLARTLLAVQNNVKNEPSDRMYPERITECKVNLDGKPIPPEILYVVEPFSEAQINEIPSGVSRLVANESLRKEYLQYEKELNFAKDDVIKALQKLSRSTDSENEIKNTFSGGTVVSIYDIFVNIAAALDQYAYKLYDFRYNDVFDKSGKVKGFVGANQSLISEYAKNYEKLMDQSTFFNKTEAFGTYNAAKLHDQVKRNEFFNAGHGFKIKDLEKEINSQEEFQDLINLEIDKILSDEKSIEIFNKIDKALQANEELRKFHAVVSTDQSIAAMLIDFEDFKKEVWYGYFSEISEKLKEVVLLYKKLKPKIDKVLLLAAGEQKLWAQSVKEFNKRFINLPFKVSINNQKDVILSTHTPIFDFDFDDSLGDGAKTIKSKDLLTVLSRGEARALYLLNVIFDIKARIADKKDTIIVFDDVVDSFDYKNKYAIIQYIKDIANVENIHVLILTHNFDFFRTINSRGIVGYNQCLMAQKTGGVVKLDKMNDFKNPFNEWRKHLSVDHSKLVASIPFVRNIVEYTGSTTSSDYMELTSMLHMKKNSGSIKVSDLNNILSNNFSVITLPSNTSIPVIDLILQQADLCVMKTDLSLCEKITLSIGSRIRAEKYMASKLKSTTIDILDTQSNQTANMITEFIAENPSTSENILNLLDDIMLKTPENIHVNAFMYEPIIDLGSDELIDLYKETQSVLV